MSIPYSGTLSRSGGITAAIAKQLKTVNLKPVKKVQFKFDPFHQKVEQTRYFMHYITAPNVLKTNLTCSFRTQIVCDRSEPTISFTLVNGEEVTFKSENLNALDMFKLFNKNITILAPKEEKLAKPIVTKAAKVSVSALRKKR